MTVEMLFEPAAGSRTAVVAPDRFRLYPHHGRYHLPRVAIRAVGGPVEVWDVFLADAAPATGALGRYLARNYPTTSWRAVTVGEPQEVSAALPVFEYLNLPGAAGRLESVRLTWRVTFGGEAVTTRDFPLLLEFAAPDAEPETETLSGGEGLGSGVAEQPLRQPVTGHQVAKMFAIDFGTSSSTITMVNDHKIQGSDLDPAQDEVLRTALAELLQSAGPDDGAARRAWLDLRDKCLRLVRERTVGLPGAPDHPFTDIDELVRLLDDAREGVNEFRARIRDLVLIALRPGATSDPLLGTWLAGRLHRILDDALYTPALTTSKLMKVQFDQVDNPDTVSSTVHVIGTDPAPARVSLVRPTEDEKGYVRSLPGLKRSLGRSRPLAPDLAGLNWKPAPRKPANSDFLVLHAYNWLIDSALRFAARGGTGQPQAVGHVVVTYPTTMPPARRERLRSLFQDDLLVPLPTFTYDEGVAAGMYFLMRELRGSLPEGMERFRSRSRPVDVAGHRVWRRNLLVIDIGGGTTDIALLALDLEDRTPAAANDPRAGCSYLITPRVLGSTGHPQLGGDLLTLRVFYWIKARLTDALVANLPEQERRRMQDTYQWPGVSRAIDGSYQPLAPMVLANQSLDPAPSSVRQALSDLLPTDAESGISTYAFNLLWTEAESVKIELGRLTGPGSVTVLDTQLDQVLAEVRRSDVPLLDGGARAPSLELSSEDFVRLVRPVVVKAADLAADIVNVRLRGADAEPLDQVFFSGRSAQMPVVRQLVGETLARRLTQHGATGAWDPSAMAVETTNAKQAASLGACWAEEQQNLRGTAEDGAGIVAQLNRGGSAVMIDVNNMFLSLPCHFFLREPDGGSGLLLLEAGTPCRYSDRNGNLAARSRWYPVPRNLRVHRDLGARESIEWGEFQFHLATHALRQTGLTLPGEPPADLYFQLQIDQDLTPTVFLCVGGTPDHLLHEPGANILPRLRAGVTGPDGTIDRLPVAIHVGAPSARHTGHRSDDATLVFPAATDHPAWPHRMHTLHPDEPPVPGMVGEQPLPAPVDVGDGRRLWQFEGVDAAGDTVVLAHLEPPDGPYDRAVPYFASLDRRGWLRVHRGYPRYLTTTRLTDMLGHPGAVFHTAMSEGEPMWNDDWDPFTGKH
ncbi:hypothetical protein ACIBO1_16700 [Micromonospora sp. NPDC049903]|uniref:hypothetical protein n=1 Tax=Micromonospora sp. NPDC049903 TaxID=3364276 RepID=UPI00378BAB39